MDWVNLAKMWVPILKDIALVIAAFLALSTWRRQLVGTKQQDAAEKLLEAVYELEYAMRTARHPNLSSSEAGDRPRSDSEDRRERSTNDKIYAYQKRFMEVQRKQFNDVRIATLKARVRLGKQVKEVVAPLNGLTAELVAHHYLWSLELSQGKDTGLENRTLFSGGDADEFSKKVDQAVEKVETFCEPWLRGGGTFYLRSRV